jgi:PAS domain S-box-containing protein
MYRILYVDDEPALLEIGKLFLEQSGQFSVDIVSSAPAALAFLKTKTYDAIISDYQMPEMDGIEFLEKIRTSGNTIPFILFTGRGREEVVIQALNKGADCYLQKGGEPKSQFTELEHQTRQAIQQRRTEVSIRDLERREADIINFLPDATFAIDTNGLVIAWNHAIEEMTNVSAAEMLGKGDYEYAIPFYGKRRPILIDLIYESEEVIVNNYAHIIQKKDILIADTTLPLPKGKPVTLMGKASPLYNRQGEVVGAIESIRDITGMKKTEDELRASYEQIAASEEELRHQFDALKKSEDALCESEEKYRRIIETANEGVWAVDQNLNTTFVNQRFADMLGYSREEMAGHNVLDYVISEDKAAIGAQFATRRTGIQSRYECKLMHRDGRTIWCLISGSPLLDDTGSFQGSFGMITDITERKRSEEEIILKNVILLTQQETSLDAILNVDESGKILNYNQKFVEIWGIPDELIASRIDEPVLQHVVGQVVDPEAFLSRVRYLYDHKNEKSFEEILLKDGRILERFSAPILGGKGKYYGRVWYFRDITERKRVEEALLKNAEDLQDAYEELTASEEELRQNVDDLGRSERALQKSEEKYRIVFETTGTATVLIEEDATISLVNLEFERLSGYHKSEIENKKKWTEFVVKEDLDRMFTQHQLRRTDRKKALTHYEFRFMSRSGEPHDVYSTIDIIPGTAKSVASLLDITERKKTEHELRSAYEQITADEEELRQQYEMLQKNGEALKESERKYRSILENIQDAYYRSDRDGNLIMISPSGIRLLGYGSENEIIGRNIAGTLYADPSKRKIFLQNLEKEGFIRNFEVALNRRDGISVPVETSSHKYYDGEGNFLGVEGIVRDISERKRAEQALASANKKLKLLSGITRHDINNQLSIMKGFLALLETKQPDTSFSENFKKINTSAQRISSMIQFTKEYEEIGVNAPIWQNCRTLVETVTKQIPLGNITVKNDFPAGAEVLADPLIVKVFYNLMDNAVRHGGKITTIRFSAQESGDNHLIICEDDGDGIPVDVKEKIFDRGFGKNTGLGLFLSREILSITNITICETGEPGMGARFEMTVPRGTYGDVEPGKRDLP